MTMISHGLKKTGTLLLLCACLLNFFLLQLLISQARLYQEWSGRERKENPFVHVSQPMPRHSWYRQQWRPEEWKLQYIYTNLNLTGGEAKSNLAYTIEGRYIFNNVTLCGPRSDRRSVDVLFVVHTAPNNFYRRIRLRRTVLNVSRFRPFEIRTVFLLGRCSSPTLQKELEEEHGHFGDTVQADFIDSYENLSLKGVLGLNWVTHHCPQVRFVFKMDDDVFVDTSKLLHRYWPLFVGKTRTMVCNVWPNGSIPISREGKWKVDNSLFPHMDFFPFHYCSGLVVLMTGDLIPFLYQATMFTPVFWIDDIFLFGILPWVSGNVTMYNFGAKKYLVFYAPIMVECLKKSGFDCRLLAAHATMPVDMFDEMWNLTLTVHDLQAQAIDVHRIA